MARIFYWALTGIVYGVHPSSHESNPKIVLPDGVVWNDVPETPDRIPWPKRNGTTGREHWSRIVNGAIALRNDLEPLVPDFDTELAQAIRAIDTSGVNDLGTKAVIENLRAALLGLKAKGR